MLVVKKCQNSLGISVYYGQCGNLTLEVVDTLSVQQRRKNWTKMEKIEKHWWPLTAANNRNCDLANISTCH